ncbi:MAG: hypothetical protein ACRER1_02340 [Gammaproteobacteria bacterium]
MNSERFSPSPRPSPVKGEGETFCPSFIARACAFTALAVLLGACANTSTPATNEAPLLISGHNPQAILSAPEMTRIADKTPPAFRDAVLRAEAFGRTIYTHDRLATEAGNLVAPGGHSSFREPLAGWLTENTSAGLTVNFLVKHQDTLAIAAEITRVQGKLQLRQPSPPRNLTSQEMILWQARQRAYTAKFKACAKRYNPVVIPARLSGVDLIYVYLLPASADPNTVYLGGYQRIAIGPDGSQILEEHAFTHGCITLQRNAQTTGVRVTELVSDSPTSAQVYASLRYDLPVYVETSSNGLHWKVEDGMITLVKK